MFRMHVLAIGTIITILGFSPLSVLADQEEPTARGQLRLQTPEPANPLEHNNRGVELGSKGLWSDALREHQSAVKGDPYREEFRVNLSAAHLRFGKSLKARNQINEAMEQFRQALFVDPKNLSADQELDECLNFLNKDPQNFSTRKQLAEDAYVNKDFPASIVEWRKCIRLSDTGLNHYKLGLVLRSAGKEVDSYREFRIAVSKEWSTDENRSLASCHKLLGSLLKESAYKSEKEQATATAYKRFKFASIEYSRAHALNPSDKDALKNQLECEQQQEKLGKEKNVDDGSMKPDSELPDIHDRDQT